LATEEPQSSPTLRGEEAAVLSAPGQRPALRPVVKLRHPGRWVLSAFVALGVVMLTHSLLFSSVVRGGVTQSRFGWGIIGEYLTTSAVLQGLVMTLELTAIAMVVGVIIGIVLAIMRMSESSVVSSVAWAYIWFFRGTPVLVQLLFWYNLSYLFPHVTVGLPFGPAFLHLNANTLITPMAAACLGLSLNEGAYMAEIVRAGISAVDEGQHEAASALGMTRMKTLRLIVLPQAMRVIIPPTGNETISMLKTSSLASAVTVTELLYSVNQIYARTYETIPLLIVASIWYLAMTSLLTIGQYYLERHYARGSMRELPATPIQKLRRMLALLKRNPPKLPIDPSGEGA